MLKNSCQSNTKIPSNICKEYEAIFESHHKKLNELRSTIEDVACGSLEKDAATEELEKGRALVNTFHKDHQAWKKVDAVYSAAAKSEKRRG